MGKLCWCDAFWLRRWNLSETWREILEYAKKGEAISANPFGHIKSNIHRYNYHNCSIYILQPRKIPNHFLWTALYLVIENTYKIITMAMMATDQIPFVSKTVIIDKLLMSALVVLLITFRIKDASYVMVAYTAAHLVACLMTLYKSKLFTSFHTINKECLNEVLLTCKVGITLMLANFVSILIMGLCRIAVERYWNIETFSKLSFSITIASFCSFSYHK